jgi:hypothetical protein
MRLRVNSDLIFIPCMSFEMSNLPDQLRKDLLSLRKAVDLVVAAPTVEQSMIDRVYALLHN